MPRKSRSSTKKSKKSKRADKQIKPEISQIKIMTVTSSNVDQANQSLMQGEAMVEYYHPNCGHCQTLKPEWERMCFEIKKNYKGKATIAAVDCSDQEMLNRLQIEKSFQGFPTIFHMKDGRSIDEYQGDRTKDALLQFAESRLPISIQRQQLKPALPFVLSPTRRRRSVTRKKKGTTKRGSLKKAVQKRAKTIRKRLRRGKSKK